QMHDRLNVINTLINQVIIILLQDLIQNDKQNIFLTKHITTDLDQISDKIVLIHKGKILLEILKEEMHERFHIIKGKSELLDADTRRLFIGIDETELGYTALF